MIQSKPNQINNFIVVTTCSQQGYLEYGKNFLESFHLFNETMPLIFVQDQEIDKVQSKENLIVIQNHFGSEIELFQKEFFHRLLRRRLLFFHHQEFFHFQLP